jgi:hypothetical protein
MSSDPFEAYKIYLSIKQHFEREDYDFFKYNGKVRVNLDSFLRRKDRFQFHKLTKIASKDLLNYVIANYSRRDKVWVGDLINDEAQRTYTDWMRVTQSQSYIFEQELTPFVQNIDSECDVKDGQHPNLLIRHLQKEVSIETLIILNRMCGFAGKWNTLISEKIFWPNIERRMRKYEPFIQYDTQKYKKIIQKILDI